MSCTLKDEALDYTIGCINMILCLIETVIIVHVATNSFSWMTHISNARQGLDVIFVSELLTDTG